jgi:hypothetical protein
MAKLADARKLHAIGWRVVAAPLAGKAPIGSWKHAQTEPATDTELKEAFSKDRNVFIITGAISRLAVLDCDDQVAVEYWRARLGDVLDETTCVSTGRGKHYYWRLAEGEVHKGRSSPGGDSGKWDLRAEGGGVVAPPSIHPTGRVYRWGQGRGPDALKDAPAELWAGEAKGKTKVSGPSSLLSHLLANPPEEGGRNNWLARVAGHYAVELKHQDAFEETVRGLGQQIGLEEPEIEKLIKSIWEAEQAKEGRAAPDAAPEGEGGSWRVTNCTEESGWLMSGNTRILTQIRERDAEGGWQAAIAPWLNADLRAIGVVVSGSTRTYHVEIRTTDDNVREATIASDTIGSPPALSKWFAGYGLRLAAPDGIYPRGMTAGARLTSYLEVQKPPEFAEVDALGEHEETGAFIAHEGIIRADGLHPFETVRPAERLKGWAPFRYGFEGGEYEAVNVLREVLTFHAEQVTAVHGSWWAACLLKPQIAREFSQFPFMALEAPSESGKSVGYMPKITELGGDARGKGRLTYASLRDAISAHRSGIVWVDDMDSLETIGELIRGTTVEGSVTKKSKNQSDQVAVRLRAALCISGEALGLRDQKAMIDRCVALEVPSPVGRRSLHGDYSQYNDIVELNRKHPDLTVFAGSLQAKALALAPEIPKKALQLRAGDGRLMDKLTIMRLGAWILRELVGRDSSAWIEREVEAWISAQQEGYDSADNSLTLKILPAALSRTERTNQPYGPNSNKHGIATPVFVIPPDLKDAGLWFSPRHLADWWAAVNKGKPDARTESTAVLAQQAKTIGCDAPKGGGAGYKEFAYKNSTGRHWYRRLPDDLAEQVLARATDKGAR